jgi:hypothetical protein
MNRRLLNQKKMKFHSKPKLSEKLLFDFFSHIN